MKTKSLESFCGATNFGVEEYTDFEGSSGYVITFDRNEKRYTYGAMFNREYEAWEYVDCIVDYLKDKR